MKKRHHRGDLRMRWQDLFNRRDFLWFGMQGAATLLMSGCAGTALRPLLSDSSESEPLSEFLRKYSPIDRTIGDLAPRSFSGDRFERPHRILWNLPSSIEGRRVESDEETDLVIVGGGVSGLFTALGLRRHQPILLEQAQRFGGNAKGQSWRGLDYSIGSAYIDLPHPGTPMDSLYRELQLQDLLVQRKNPDPIEYHGKLYRDFWNGETEPQSRSKYQKLSRFFSDLREEREHAFPLIPSLHPEQFESARHFDQFDLRSLLAQVAGGSLSPHLETALEHYCWSTYAASSSELSAAAGLNFLAQESNPICIAAGGNSKIAERVLERLTSSIPQRNLRAGCLVVQVKVVGDRVHVLYEDPEGKLRKIRARCAVLSCPKFVAARILDGMEPTRREAIAKLRYRSYMVGNLLLKRPVKNHFYDLFMINKGKIDLREVRKAQENQNATDVILANFADEGLGGKNREQGVLTFYRAFPFDGARSELFQPSSYDVYRKRFERQIADQILPLLGLRAEDIVDLRLTLWGHALPLAAKGLYRDGTVEKIRKPFRDRVFFVEQDNWAYPALQTGATESVLLKGEIEKVLG